MQDSLSRLADNLSEGIHSEKCADCKSCLDYMITKDDQLIFRCFDCKKNYKKDFNNDILKDLQTHMSFVTETLIIFFVIKERCLFL